MAAVQSRFDTGFSTRLPANPVFCHHEFLEKLEAMRRQPPGMRASLLLHRLAVDERRLHFKATQGANRGWRRSRLGGAGGSHFYCWWTTLGSRVLSGNPAFAGAPERSIFVRDIRHHDDHRDADAQSFADYLPLTVSDLRTADYAPDPWTDAQARFARARSSVRTLKGYPGSGKTTALLHAADATGAARVLYLTYSAELAALARLHFDRYCSAQRQFDVLTFDALLQRLSGLELPADDAEARRRFRCDLAPYSRYLGPWNDCRNELYDEMHAHLIGAALPVQCGRFLARTTPRVADREYRQRRNAVVGVAAGQALTDAAGRLERDESRSLAERYFPELWLAWTAAKRLAANSLPEGWDGIGCIAVDECQDLTPLEAWIVISLAARSARGTQLLFAGDEAQTVRPTDFEWGWLHEMLHFAIAKPADFQLSANLRSPRSIATVVNRAWELYGLLGKRDRPRGVGSATIEDDVSDQVLHGAAAAGDELDTLLRACASREGLAIVAFDEETRHRVPEDVRPSVLSPLEIKGLDFHSVCVLDAGRQLQAIVDVPNSGGEVDALRRRLRIDSLRVALSRPAERLIWLDIAPSYNITRQAGSFLQGTSAPRAPLVASAVLRALEEDGLAPEERVRRSMSDARQYLSVRPDLAYSRARQAVALLGYPPSPVAIEDESLQLEARLTLVEVCFTLAWRRASLSPELGRPNLYREAAFEAEIARRDRMAAVIYAIENVLYSLPDSRPAALAALAARLIEAESQLEPWLLVQIGERMPRWVEEVEDAMHAGTAATLSEMLPELYSVLRLPDAEVRSQRIRQKALRVLIRAEKWREALALLDRLPEPDPRMRAVCLEGRGNYAEAAALFETLGDPAEALRCVRLIPDFDRASALLAQLPEHPAKESYAWLARVRAVLEEKPAAFSRAMLPSEKKILERLVEQALVARRRPAPRKKAVVKRSAAAPRTKR